MDTAVAENGRKERGPRVSNTFSLGVWTVNGVTRDGTDRLSRGTYYLSGASNRDRENYFSLFS